jgi:hypothetical protein
MSWIKRLAIDETLRTKGLRLVIYLRVPGDSPKGYFERPEPIAVGSEGKVRTICLLLRENPREYYIQDIGHFESMYGEPLWRKKVSTYYKMERPGSIPKVSGGCHLHYIFRKGGSCRYEK